MGPHAVRAPAVAGFFYPDDPALLRAVVEDFLIEAAPPPLPGRPKALIAPHAGYIHSGPVAARAYRALADTAPDVRRVVLVGPAHFVAFHGIAVPRVAAMASPLGEIAIDQAGLAAIRDLPQVVESDGPHLEEHALEVHLPFLQTVLERFTVVPLLVGEARPAAVAEVLGRLWNGPRTLIVVSSDLSHYHPYDEARHRDRRTAAAIEAFADEAIGPEDACGCVAIAGLLIEARARGLHIVRLDLRTSGDTSGERHRVVGYGAWALCERPDAPSGRR
ncbi:MAG: AmmeMemoRadiSam system protein B [Alphaproteobacteria bacterium]|nr:MAG: AmmeMemoRadiSam system protein B [Alphaproteobacteria bacterium]